PPECRSRAHPQGRHDGAHPQGEPALGRGKGVGDDRHTRREEGRAAESLEGASDDEPWEGSGSAAERRAHGEEHQPGHPDRLASDEVGHAPKRQEGRGDDDEVGDDHHSTAPPNGVWKVHAMDGRLMLTIDVSRVVMKVPTTTTPSTAHLWVAARLSTSSL